MIGADEAAVERLLATAPTPHVEDQLVLVRVARILRMTSEVTP